ncbi:MAG: hypothetical protein CL997_02540 [Euryarchaeota archaeon]|nr:hypothetical protein [Euryarchaeota archaeon]
MATLWATIFGLIKVIVLSSESMVILQERMVHLTEQLSMPLIEVSLIVNRWIKALLSRLEELADEHNESLPENVKNPIPLAGSKNETNDFNYDLERVLKMVDDDRMDILDTLIRVTIEEEKLSLMSALLFMRNWEFEMRKRLEQVQRPGQLFSPVTFEDGF